MEATPTVLVLGGTGRTGRRVVEQLLERGAHVRAIVRSAGRLPAGSAGHPNLRVVEADVLDMTDDALAAHVDGCDAVVSCLGHPNDVRGIFGPPHQLVEPVIRRIRRAVAAAHPERPVRLVLMSSVSVYVPDERDARRGVIERAVVRALCAAVPPARDNQRTADFLRAEVGASDPCLEWAVVRPDTLVEGEVSRYAAHPGLVSSLARPDESSRANVAHFMCELATGTTAWSEWAGKLPVVVNSPA